MNKKVINLVLAVVIGFVAIYLINSRLQERERVIRQLIQKGELTEVVIATQDIPKNSVIKAKMIALARVPAKDAQPGILTSADSVEGKVATVDILRNQFLYANMVRLPEQAQTLSQKIPKGKRAYTISIDQISAVGGQVKAGDLVDVVAIIAQGREAQRSMVMTVFEAARILDVNSTEAGLQSVTLALTGEEIKILTYVLEIGKIKFVLRSPLDTTQEGALRPFSLESFTQKVQRAMGITPGVSQQPATQQQPQQKPVEIYRGGLTPKERENQK